jgi:hypothetical protein
MKAHYDEKKCLVTNIILQGVVCLNFNNVNIKNLIFKIFLAIILVQNTKKSIGEETFFVFPCHMDVRRCVWFMMYVIVCCKMKIYSKNN